MEQLQAKLGNLTPVFRDLGEALKISHRERFSRGVGPDGQPWPELSAGYRTTKKKNKGKMLVLDGWLRDLHYQAGGTELRLGTDKKYGAIHQFGFSGSQLDVLAEWWAADQDHPSLRLRHPSPARGKGLTVPSPSLCTNAAQRAASPLPLRERGRGRGGKTPRAVFSRFDPDPPLRYSPAARPPLNPRCNRPGLPHPLLHRMMNLTYSLDA